MKRLNHCIALAIILLFINGHLNAQDKQNVSKWPKGVTYEIFVQSFADSNGDGIGDIKGMTSKLDYLQSLGIESVWLMPINPSPSYHKYDVTDYSNIHPDYGTIDDFKDFVREAHNRNIKVIIDLVLNHCGKTHFWFQEALKDPNSKYWDYFVWTHKDDPQTKVEGKIISGDSFNRRRWVKVDGSDYLYYAYFGGSMPDLNYDNPKLRQEVFQIGKFWLSEVGIDGFRLDAARHIFPEERATDNHKWWEYFLKEMQSVRKDVYIVGEVWAPAEIVGPYLNGIPALFNFDLGGEIIKAVNNGDGSQLAAKHKKIEDFYLSINPNYTDATFLTNHDQNRVMSSVNGQIEKMRMAVALLLTLPGSPYLYYGEEIGMLGKKPDQNIREPFLWDIKQKDQMRASWIQPRNSTDSTVVPASVQLTDKNSLLNYYKTFIQLRNRSYALTFGQLIPVDLPDKPAISAFIRSDEHESLLVIHNLSKEKTEIQLPSEYLNYTTIYFAYNGAQLKQNKVQIPGYSTLILKKTE